MHNDDFMVKYNFCVFIYIGARGRVGNGVKYVLHHLVDDLNEHSPSHLGQVSTEKMNPHNLILNLIVVIFLLILLLSFNIIIVN